MMKKIVPFIFLALLACEKESTEFQFNHKISLSYEINDVLRDSLVYYYNSDNQLLRVDRFYSPVSVSKYNVKYQDNTIDNWDGQYTIGANGMINSFGNTDYLTELAYTASNVAYEKSFSNNAIFQEKFFDYRDGNLIKDSMVTYHTDGESLINVYKYEYTDSLAKEFMMDFTGLYEMPRKSKNLRRQAENEFHGILYKYSYELSENEVVQIAEIYNSFQNKKVQTQKTVFRLIKKQSE